MVTRRKIRRRKARQEAAFWKRFEDGWQKEVSPLIEDISQQVFKRLINDGHVEVRYDWGEVKISEPPKGRIFGLITD